MADYLENDRDFRYDQMIKRRQIEEKQTYDDQVLQDL